MTMATTSLIDDLTLNVEEEIRVDATIDQTFEALLEQMGPASVTPDGAPLPMVLEARPGGRWFRDLGDDNGHHWGHVQAIKRPGLLEISGPLFMSYPVVSNLQYRLTTADEGTLITVRHAAMGLLPDDHRTGLSRGWRALLDRVRTRAESTQRLFRMEKRTP